MGHLHPIGRGFCLCIPQKAQGNCSSTWVLAAHVAGAVRAEASAFGPVQPLQPFGKEPADGRSMSV